VAIDSLAGVGGAGVYGRVQLGAGVHILFWLLRYLEASQLSAFTYLAAGPATILGIWWLGERGSGGSKFLAGRWCSAGCTGWNRVENDEFRAGCVRVAGGKEKISVPHVPMRSGGQQRALP